MFERLRMAMLRPKCPNCGHRPMKSEKRTGPIPCGRDPMYVFKCPKCGQIVDLPGGQLMKLCT